MRVVSHSHTYSTYHAATGMVQQTPFIASHTEPELKKKKKTTKGKRLRSGDVYFQ